jgi:glycosyltransferase involved in cell wall biosynthesis
VIRQWRPPERPFNALGLPAGTSHALPAWWALRRSDADIAQGWTAPAALAAARSGKPSVFVFQGVLHEDDIARRPRTRALLMRAARECDVVTAYSDVAAREFTRITGVEAGVIEPGIRLDAFTPGADGERAAPPAPTGARSAAPVIFCAADPDEPRKRVRLLVEAFAQVRRARPDAELWLMPASDPAIASAPGVRIVDPGADRDALVALYRSAWVSVLPAFREAFGLVVVESLACGTPVVGMRDGGAVPELLGDERWVAEPDPDSLARTLLTALDTPADPQTCRRRAEQYSIERCAERYEALYRELLAA